MEVGKFNCEITQYARKLWNGSVCLKIIPTRVTDFKIDLEISLSHGDDKIKSLLLKLIDKLKDAECSVVIQRGISE